MSRFPRREYERVLRAIEGLAEDPKPTGARKMRGTGNLGEVLVFTGSLSMLRGEAAIMAARAGCAVRESVSKTTTMLVVGDQDIRKLAGHNRSSKHRKAESLILAGQQIRILSEQDCCALVQLDSN